ncbi:MAG: polysaccharide deacetylase family protein [Hyphomicrobiaceae bacterium]|nr:polysaccharide deacetylase family protein [Hyphomicrobiaceae bacterium]
MRVLSAGFIGLALAIAGTTSAIAQTAGAPAAAAAANKAPAPAAAPAAAAAPCANPDALGVVKTLEIDTTGGPGFGLEQYKVHDFLQPKEVVLTFDDGPQVRTTKAILDALAEQCTKATFFSIGKMALGLPEILRDVAARGHTIGSHTWSHADLGKLSKKDPKLAIEEFEKGLSGVHRALGGNVSSFFRFPYLKDSKEMVEHLSQRNIAMFSMDADSFDFKNNPDQIVKTVMTKLEAKGKGIILLHDIQPRTATAMPKLLKALKDGGYKVVHLKSKTPASTLPEYDAMIEKDVKGLPTAGNEKPTSSIVRTVPNEP